MSETATAGTLYVVSTPIGNLDDITLRAIAILGSVELIAAEDTRKTLFLLNHLGISKPVLSYYSYNEARRVPELIEKLARGASIAVVTDAGTPGISDPASLLVRAAIERSIPVVPIPGASAILPAIVASGLPTDAFVFEGFLPSKKGRRTAWLRLQNEERTIALYESPHRIVKALEEILEFLGDRPIAVARELTKKFEEFDRGPVSEVLERIKKKEPRGEYVVVIGGAERKKKSKSTEEHSDRVSDHRREH